MLKVLMRCFSLNRLMVALLALGITQSHPIQAQTPSVSPNNSEVLGSTPDNGGEITDEDLSNPTNLRPLTQADSLLSSQGAQRLVSEANKAVNAENYDLAASKLQQARTIFNQLSNFYLQLANSFSGIDSKIYQHQRESALETGQMRDSATYQLALVHRAQDKPELAVPLLVQVIRSQDPTSDLGKKCYRQLYELGFVDMPFGTSSTATTPNN
ncbi:hypothetical protein [cyanobacterium endosymbiont of Epithemia clementina EcSB]|uniref:hypothetical protein n=1 Tax=cyanobacterium endosymbiont of Epithemia clementina EcSB TaxID=3034674 RepID=UPI00248064C7|nr:hypothetical protein [cyanobacterium endosymbiont of Epithemia clementina EcSB]WGT67986.1 hypothetical protein P3F56_02580 [cyanobacterium endosymbiont of Epithemia clementina EcSB]